jgi:hypothetical protein
LKQVSNSVNRNNNEKRIAVLKLELDYELATLYEAINENDEKKKRICKQKIEMIRQEMIQLNVKG